MAKRCGSGDAGHSGPGNTARPRRVLELAPSGS